MRRYAPWLFALPPYLWSHKALTCAVLVLCGVLGWKTFGRSVPKVQREAAASQPAMRATVTDQDPLVSKVEQMRLKEEARDKAEAERDKVLKALLLKADTDAKAREEERTQAAQRLAQQQQQFDATLAQARTVANRDRVAVKPSPPPASRPVAVTATQPLPAPSSMFELRTLRPEKREGQPRPLPPLANQDETAYLAAGCLAQAQVVTGVMATSQLGGETWGHPVLFRVTNRFHCPWQQQGPGRLPNPSGIELPGCFAIGKAKADMSSSRAIIQVELLSCVWPDGSSYEVPIKGYATDQDGTLGIVGELHTHDSQKIALAFLTGLLREASAAFGLAKSQLVVTGTGGVQPFQGAQSTLDQVANFWLQQARALLPTLWVKSDTPAYLVMLEGVPLQGYPVVALLGRDR